LPQYVDGAMVLIRHPMAASGAKRWETPSDSAQEVVWTLAEAAPEPLSIIVRTRWGEPAPWAQLALWIDGYRVSDAALQWLTYSRSGSADANGFWSGSHLPKAPLRVLAWGRSRIADAQSGAFDGFATAISYPWDHRIEIEALD